MIQEVDHLPIIKKVSPGSMSSIAKISKQINQCEKLETTSVKIYERHNRDYTNYESKIINTRKTVMDTKCHINSY
jgi:hypothetical protein